MSSLSLVKWVATMPILEKAVVGWVHTCLNNANLDTHFKLLVDMCKSVQVSPYYDTKCVIMYTIE